MSADEARKCIGKRVWFNGEVSGRIEGTLSRVGDQNVCLTDCVGSRGGYTTFYPSIGGISLVVDCDQSPPPPARKADAYPHSCPKCGSRAYVGFIQVEHEHGGNCHG
jgi:hypothetical protein